MNDVNQELLSQVKSLGSEVKDLRPLRSEVVDLRKQIEVHQANISDGYTHDVSVSSELMALRKQYDVCAREMTGLHEKEENVTSVVKVLLEETKELQEQAERFNMTVRKLRTELAMFCRLLELMSVLF